MPAFAFDRTNPRATEWAAKHAAKLVKDVSKTTRARIKAIIVGGFEEQFDVREIAKRIYEELDNKKRAMVIARNEVMVASNRGQEEAWAQAVDVGLLTGDELKEVLVTPDDRLCPVCEPMDGRTAYIWADFVGPDGEDMEGPPFHVQCRCVTGIAAPVARERAAGGQGSGNFGHAGRPGEVGGSTSDFHHATSVAWAKKIQKEGLKEGYAAEDPKGAVYYGLNFHKGKQFAIVVAKPEARKYFEQEEDGIFRLPVGGSVPPNLIKEVRIYNRSQFADNMSDSGEWLGEEMPDPIRVLEAGDVYIVVPIPEAIQDGSDMYLERLDMVGQPAPKALGGRGSGNYGHAGRPGEVGGSAEGSREARIERAINHHKPFTLEKDRWAAKNETLAIAMLDGEGTDNNSPVDVVVRAGGKTFGVEVKTLLDNTNDKVTVRGDALARKQFWARSNHASLHTLVIDDRAEFGADALYSGNRLYYRRGVGSFRLENMARVRDGAHLKELMRIGVD